MYKVALDVIREYKVLEDQQQQVIRALNAMDKGTRWAEELPKYECVADVFSPSSFLLTEQKRNNIAFINLINGYYHLKWDMVRLGEIKIQQEEL
jgi:hypothetical protein